MDAYFIGIDLGGSKILATIFKDEQALESAINSTDPLAGEEGLARDLVQTVEEALEVLFD